MNGDMNVAPAFAANKACVAEKHKVTFIIIFLSDNALHASKPDHVRGTFIATFFAILLRTNPSSIIPSAFVAVTSALTGPDVIEQISLITSLKSLPDFAIIEGLVVTPSTIPDFVNSVMASISALSIKNFICYPVYISKFNSIFFY